MRHKWVTPSGEDRTLSADDAPKFVPSTVLLEQDGPLLVVLRHRGRMYLALIVEMTGHCTRWIMSAVSAVELDALRAREIAVRAVLAKPRMIVADYSHSGELIWAWEVAAEDVPESVMPEAGALLPGWLR